MRIYTATLIQMDNKVLKQLQMRKAQSHKYAYLCRILSSLLLSCVLSIPGRAAATRRKSWKRQAQHRDQEKQGVFEMVCIQKSWIFNHLDASEDTAMREMFSNALFE